MDGSTNIGKMDVNSDITDGENQSANKNEIQMRNVFLSRVFGMQTEDMSSAIKPGEMSVFPLPINGNDNLSLNKSDLNDNERRIPESDPGTTTTGEDEDDVDDINYFDDDIGNNYRGSSKNINGTISNGVMMNSASYYAGPEQLSNTNFNEYESLLKQGQASSDDEYDNSEGNNNEIFSKSNMSQFNKGDKYVSNDLLDKPNNTRKKSPIKNFNNNNNNIDGLGTYPSSDKTIINAKTLFQNMIDLASEDDGSDYFSDNEFLFANSHNKQTKDKNTSSIFGNMLPNMQYKQKSKHKNNLFTTSKQKLNDIEEGRRASTKLKGPSFSWGTESSLKTPLRKPNLGKNISILNNTPQHKINTLSPKEISLWKWANVENLDIFLQDIYKYYLGNGFFCILLQKLLNLATLIFVVFISTFMGYCVDYSKFHSSTIFSEIMVDQCYSNNIIGMPKILLWVFYVFIILKIVQFYFDIKNLLEIRNFYTCLLEISDKELQTISWQSIIQQLMYLKDQNALTANVVEVKAKNKIDPLIVANRIMRKDNYLIALYNDNILDLSLPIPFYRTSILTKTLEWNINLCVIGFAFNEKGFLKQPFLKTSQHAYLSEELKKRFVLAGVLNIILSPFLVTYFVLLYFFRYFNEFKSTPGKIGARQYTPIAEWKFREFNELYHLFQKRLGLSTELADKYINQFPKESFDLVLNFISFISGSFVAILVSLTLFDSEHFLNIEITKDRTAIFYITIFGAIWTICKNSISDEYKVFDPEETVKELSTFTHYLPHEWTGKYHSEEVKQDFCKMYNLRVIILLRELASLILTPFVLWFSLPKCSQKIIEFISESSVYIDGLGYVCKYAMFDLPKLDNETRNDSQYPIELNSRAKQDIGNAVNTKNSISIPETVENVIEDSDSDDGEYNGITKMMQSYMYFMDDYDNADNALGKNQIPNKGSKEAKKANNSSYNTNYSWKKQFQPGQRPELFRIGKHAVRNPTSFSNGNTSQLNNIRRKSNISKRGSLGESFINSDVLTNPNIAKSYMLTSEKPDDIKKEGILKMVKDYYKTTDIGR